MQNVKFKRLWFYDMIMYYNDVAGLFDYAQRTGFRIIVGLRSQGVHCCVFWLVHILNFDFTFQSDVV